jgi:hypothetical protein
MWIDIILQACSHQLFADSKEHLDFYLLLVMPRKNSQHGPEGKIRSTAFICSAKHVLSMMAPIGTLI